MKVSTVRPRIRVKNTPFWSAGQQPSFALKFKVTVVVNGKSLKQANAIYTGRFVIGVRCILHFFLRHIDFLKESALVNVF